MESPIKVIGAGLGEPFDARYLICFAVSTGKITNKEKKQSTIGVLSSGQHYENCLGPDTFDVLFTRPFGPDMYLYEIPAVSAAVDTVFKDP